MEPVRRVGRVFFPLDDELALLPGSLTPKQQEHLVHLGSWMPFAQAAAMLQTLLGVQVSEPTVRRGTERAGALYEGRQTRQSQQPMVGDAQGTLEVRQVISTDGAYVPLIGGAWAEVRTVVVGEVKQEVSETAKDVRTHHVSCFARMTDAAHFGELAEVEMRRRGVSRAKAVCAVTDGALWIQGFIDVHRWDAVRILDFPHAAEHLSLLIEALEQAGVRLPENAFERSLHVLKHRGPGLLLRWCTQLPEAIVGREAVQKQREYFSTRVGLMQYPVYRQQGWPIGSGMVESANKVVVQARLKGAGMHWEPNHVNPMLALRSAVCSDRWEEAWQERLQEHNVQRSQTRQHTADAHVRSCLSALMLSLLRFHPPTPTPKPPPSSPQRAHPAATLPGSSCPSPSHPWKRGPACRPRSVATI